MKWLNNSFAKRYSLIFIYFINGNTPSSFTVIVVFNKAIVRISFSNDKGVCQKMIWWVFDSYAPLHNNIGPICPRKSHAPPILFAKESIVYYTIKHANK